MTAVELLLVHVSVQDYLTVCKQIEVNRMICIGWRYLESFDCQEK